MDFKPTHTTRIGSLKDRIAKGVKVEQLVINTNGTSKITDGTRVDLIMRDDLIKLDKK